MTRDIAIYSILAASSILNIIVPISGSATVTPLIAALTDPHRALGLASFYFFLSGVVRAYLFRKEIQWEEIKTLFMPSISAAFIGAFALVSVSPRILLSIVFFFTIYFFLKKINVLEQKKTTRFTSFFVGIFSGFMQGTGIAGSDLRNNYLYAQGLNLAQLHGTTALIGPANFFVATVVRLFTKQITVPDLTPLLYIFPFIVAGNILGRHALYKFSKQVTDFIIIGVMLAAIIFLGIKLF